MRRIRHRAGLLLLGGGLAMLSANPCTAAERELEKAPPPSSTEEIKTPLQRIFFPEAYRKPIIPWIGQQLQKLPPFFADTQLEARFRTYYLRKDRTNELLSEGWAIGGSLHYRSGWLKDLFSVEAEGFTSQPVFAPDSRAGTGLLAPIQQSYSVLGIANARLRYKGVVLTGYRQYLDLPFVNRNDSRMTPQTFEAVTLAKSEGKLRFSTGYVWRIKRVNSDDFIDMGKAVGLPKSRGLAYGNFMWQPSEEFHIGSSFGIVPDVLAGVYTEAAYGFALGRGWSVRLDGQLEYQWSVGDELLDSVETWNLGLRASTSWQGLVMRLGFSITDDDSPILSPYGSNPSYVDLMQRTFNKAGEKAVLLSLSYDFSHLGINGLSTILNYVEGWDGRLLGVRQDGRELDLTIDYKIPKELGLYEGLWLRLRASWLDEQAADQDGTDFRVILRYDFPVI
jgi:hypothetical protein